MDSKIFSLSQVTASIHKTLSQRYSSSFWVTAEMNRLGYQPSSGHAFPELVEKRGGKIIAQMRAFILKNDMLRIQQKFLAGAHEELQDNIKILFLAEISYHTIHGLSLQIRDIDPTYTLGDLEKEKIECIKKLKDQGLFDLNRKQVLSPAPKNIAVISSTTSKGFEDFLFTLEKAAPNIKFQIELFSAALQGAEAPNSIINQLNIIKHKLHNFEAVAIIRGGGGDVGLSCYNDYQLATTIAQFPLPVFIGVGHKSNETIAELIAHGSGITPTAVAEIFVQRCIGFINTIEQIKNSIIHLSNQLIAESFSAIKNMAQIIHHNSVYQFQDEEISLSHTIHRLTRL
ncbi:MAG: exodeoxyribonuclease VII large subunit, partial [Flavobacteriales bacterium]